jgi:hypothetical protein
MTEAETSIEQLSDNREATENSTIIDEILDEINKSVPTQDTPQGMPQEMPKGMPQEMPKGMPQEMSQEMPQDYNPNITLNEGPEGPEGPEQPASHQPQEYQQMPINYDVTEIKDPIPEPSLLNNIDSTTDTLGYLKDNILEELKLPTVVLILFIILSSSRIDSLFVKTHSNFFVDSVGSLTFPSLFIKGIIAALIFYIFKLFV